VIAVDLQGHGRTADIARPLDTRLMADDIAALIDHIGLEKPDLVGYSLGGRVALLAAATYPKKVGRLVVTSVHIRPDAIYPEMRVEQGQVNADAVEFMKDTPMYQLYQRVAPHPEDFPRLLDKAGEAMSKDFDYTDEVRGLQVPTLIVAADADMAPPSHHAEVFKLLDGRSPRRWLDGRRPSEGWPRARDPARPDSLQHLHLAAVRRGDPRLPGLATALNEPRTFAHQVPRIAPGVIAQCIFPPRVAVGDPLDCQGAREHSVARSVGAYL